MKIEHLNDEEAKLKRELNIIKNDRSNEQLKRPLREGRDKD